MVIDEGLVEVEWWGTCPNDSNLYAFCGIEILGAEGVRLCGKLFELNSP